MGCAVQRTDTAVLRRITAVLAASLLSANVLEARSTSVRT